MFRGGWGTGATSDLSAPSLETAVALQRMKRLWPEQMVRVAERAIGEGPDSPALLELSTLSGRHLEEAPKLFAEALADLGVDQPDLVSAARLSIEYWATEVLEGRLPWRSGVSFMWQMLIDHFWEDWENLPGGPMPKLGCIRCTAPLLTNREFCSSTYTLLLARRDRFGGEGSDMK